MTSVLTPAGWVVKDDVVDERNPLPRLTQAEIDDLNARIAAGDNHYPTGTQIVRVSDETVMQKEGVGTAARFVAFSATGVRADLAASTGTTLIGYDGGTVRDVLDSAKPIASYAALRAYTGRATSVRITARGIGGFFLRDDADTTTADNGGTVIVDASSRRWKRLFVGAYNVKWFGAVGNGVTDDRAAIQVAIDYLNAIGGGTLLFPDGTYLIGSSGSTIVSRLYGLLLKSNVTLMGQSKFGTVLKRQTGADIDLVNTERASSQSRIGLMNMTLDGNEAADASLTAGFNLWAHGITQFDLENIHSLNPGSWGLRIEQCDFVQYDGITCDHSAETNSDGIHFVDTLNVTGGTCQVKTLGDDGFIIEALNRDVYNYSLGPIVVEVSTSSISSGKRGFLLLADPNVITAARTISNINAPSVTVYNCVGQAVLLQGASYYNVRIGAVDKGCGYGLYLTPGAPSYAGTIRGCSFDIVSHDTVNEGMISLETNGTITDNDIDLRVVNPGNNMSGVLLRGSGWRGSVALDYNPYSTKTLYAAGVAIYGSNNDLAVSAKGSDSNLLLQGTATNNNIRVGLLTGGVTYDLQTVAGATGNRFTGGRIAGTILNSGGATNKFSNVGGATNYGTASVNMATLGTGEATFAHGLSGTPTCVLLQLKGSSISYHYTIQSVDGTNVTIVVRDTTGAAVVTGTLNFFFEASL